MLSVIIPAANEQAEIEPCLAALLASDPVPCGAEAIVVVNGCRDDTAGRARAMAGAAAAAGWGLRVIELAQGGKPGALTAGDAAAAGPLRAWLDADVRVSPPLMAQIALALDGPGARYATGRPVVAPARSVVTRTYARFWQRLPFARGAAPGFGLYAVNAEGRARWGAFPDIIADDTFVRLTFAPAERTGCAAGYTWPMVEGFAALVRVRRRQDAGVAEVARLFPALAAHDDTPRPRPVTIARAALADPAGFAVYALVSLAVRLRRGDGGWTRGR